MSENNLLLDDDVVEDGDFLGGYSVFDTGVYPFKIDLAYKGVSAAGAQSLNLVFKKGILRISDKEALCTFLGNFFLGILGLLLGSSLPIFKS